MSKLLIFALFILFVIFAVRWQGGQYQQFMACAAKVTGKLTKKEEKPARGSTGNRMEHVVSYSYTVDGVEYNGEDNVEFTDTWLDLTEGQDLEIYYSKKNPSESHPVVIMNNRLGDAPATLVITASKAVLHVAVFVIIG